MKKLLYLTILIFSLSSCVDEEEKCIDQIKSCIINKGGEVCISTAINEYCGTNFDPHYNEWWYEMQDWAKESDLNKKKLIKLANKIEKEAEKTVSKELDHIARKWIKWEICRVKK